MLTRSLLAIAAAVVVAFTCTVATAKNKKPKIKPGVNYARTWDAAVEEAKKLNVPIVVHSHGFY